MISLVVTMAGIITPPAIVDVRQGLNVIVQNEPRPESPQGAVETIRYG